ncbi:DNA-binding transcriptional regulator, LysR family [Rhodoblastus acidophilus]|uniref:DNA-binding transcriptional regulator, LysR family n=1 Tax=Rhodoblastus acidophilus TaxID=1074 RepID=A0A212S8E1_RHOAC|nr:LysR family transcriptional regulator [Rhodoblastus acidophilus]PPQ36809.1 LysR family transcriptional regulator [Rhodoblastus acidophilus]RAI21393.1 LysR family transcriptional regulator [Rhodoblastus acidophilus]SNB81589.1 DNA-binding transcriptional regulator, LysR family [Rhodoblastus acidophilus]
MADRLTAMEVFVRALRLGGLSAAARELRMSPAMAAKHLDALEARLGTTLVRRTTRKLSLTEAGADYLDKAERILAEIAEAEADASSRSLAIEGVLRVSAPATFGVLHIAPLAPLFHERHPNVILEFGFSDRYVDLLDERWDMAIRIGRLADSSLVARKLAPMRAVVCASPNYLARRGTPKLLSDLIAHDCLGYTLAEQAGPSSWRFGLDGEIKAPVRGWLRANNGEALLRAAMAGQGLVYGPRYIAAEALAAGSLVELTLDQPPTPVGAVHALTHPDRRPAAKTRAWIEFLAETLSGLAADW